MAYLLDSNVLVYMANTSAPQHESAIAVPQLLVHRVKSVFTSAQVLTEYYRAVTRPAVAAGARPGLGFSPEKADSDIEEFLATFGFVADTPAIFTEWRRIARDYKVVGNNAHDARIVATMRAHGIGRLLTFNTKDFQRYAGIGVISPGRLPELLRAEAEAHNADSPEGGHPPEE